MGSGEQSVEKVYWMPIWLPLSADSWDSHLEGDKQFGEWFESDGPLECAHCPHMFIISHQPTIFFEMPDILADIKENRWLVISASEP